MSLPKNRLTAVFNTLTVKKGDMFEIELLAIPGAGYLWEPTVLSGQAQLVKQEYIDEDTGICGGVLTQRFTFRADHDGDIQIRTDYRRPWESCPPAETHVFQIKVG